MSATQTSTPRRTARLPRLCARAPIGMLLIGRDGALHDANASFERLTGRGREEVCRPDWLEHLVIEHDRANLRALLQAGRPFDGHVAAITTRAGDLRIVEWSAEARDADGMLVAYGVDVTARVRAEQQALLFDRALQHSVPNVVLLDADYRYVRVSEAYASACGIPAAELIGKRHFDLFPSPLAVEHAPSRLAKEIYRRNEEPYAPPDRPDLGTTFWDVSFVPLLGDDGEIEYMLISANDMTDRRRAKDRLERSEQRLRLALEASGQTAWELDFDRRCASCTPDYARMLGFEPEELACEPFQRMAARIHPEDVEAADPLFRERDAGNVDRFEATFRVRTRSGDWKWLHAHGRIVERDAHGRRVRVIGTSSDIDAQKESERRLASSLAEKETLLREVHHRVKNNIQIISSLLYFQGAKATTRETAAALEEVRRRLLAIGVVHQHLYESTNLTEIVLCDYVRALTTTVWESLGRTGTVRVVIPPRPLSVTVEFATPLGMILCELLVNSSKYAWPGRDGGDVEITLALTDDEVVVTISDDGVGFPAGFAPDSAASFGWRLVSGLSAQMGAELRTWNAGGACVSVTTARTLALRRGIEEDR